MPRLPRIPDILTTANLSCGVASILLASQGQLTLACWLVFAGAAFDVLDGLAARALGGGSELGKQLDSLADMVTFGVAPGMLIWFTFEVNQTMFWILPLPVEIDGSSISLEVRKWMMVSAVLSISIASAWRLAKFNTDTRQSSGFLGLPTPANGLFWTSLCLTAVAYAHPFLFAFNGRGLRTLVQFFCTAMQYYPVIILLGALLLGGLMLSELPLPGLKFKHMRWRENEVIYLLLGIGLVLVLLYGILAVPLILLLYLLSPLWGKLFPKPTEK